MLTAHLPSGYILARHWLNRWPSVHVRLMLLAGVVGAVVPDLDMLWFHLVDNRQTHHHRYFTHWPLVGTSKNRPRQQVKSHRRPSPGVCRC